MFIKCEEPPSLFLITRKLPSEFLAWLRSFPQKLIKCEVRPSNFLTQKEKAVGTGKGSSSPRIRSPTLYQLSYQDSAENPSKF